MFFEAVARIGIHRYYHKRLKGECASRVEAIELAINTIKENWIFDTWEGWRWKYLYKVEV